MKFEGIPIENLKCDGFSHFLSCGQDGDVAWQERAALLLPTSSQAREISFPNAYLHDVRWDGRQLWIATGGRGIIVYSLDGKLRAEIGADQGLPPADRNVVLHVLAPGKVCAAGSFGEHCRAWCADG